MKKKSWSSQESLTRKQFFKLSEEEKYRYAHRGQELLEEEMGDDDVRFDRDLQIKGMKENLWDVIDQAGTGNETFDDLDKEEFRSTACALMLSINEVLFEILREVKSKKR